MGLVSPSIRPYANEAEREASDIADALGGLEQLTPQERAVIGDFARLGLVMRSHLARHLQHPEDTESSRALTGFINGRLKILAVLGMKRRSKEIASLRDYTEAQGEADARENAANQVDDVDGQVLDVRPVDCDLDGLGDTSDDGTEIL